MIVLIVNKHRVLAFKCKSQSPITVYPYRPVTVQITAQQMKSPTRYVQLFRCRCLIQGGKLAIELFGLMRLDARLAALLKKCLDPLVSK